MELSLSTTLLPGDPRLVDHIVGEVKSQGIFDQFRKECIADVDTKPAYQNLRTRVESSVNSFLDKQIWKPDLNKNQLRETLRKHIHEAPYLDVGVERIVDQVVNPKVYSVFMPQIEDVVYKFLGIERPKPKEKSGVCGLKDLLPKDLDPVSPESDKNSLKDVSLESVDAIDDLELKKEEKSEKQREDEVLESIEQFKDKDGTSENGHISCEGKTIDESLDKIGVSNVNLNTSDKSDDKMEEEEEDSPMFEPIDIMNLNESNISNDSHLSGISELTSHRSRSPDFSNELSQDNFDYSNQDSQLSKVSSDSRLSIVTEFGLSNHASTPIQETAKEETNKDIKYEAKGSKDNFKAVREFESYRSKGNKTSCDTKKNKDNVQELKEKDSKISKIANQSSSDVIDSSSKDKYDSKDYKEVKSKDGESTKTKSSKEKDFRRDSKDSRDSKNKEKDSDKKKQSSHSSSSSSSSSSSKYDKYSSKNRVIKDKVEVKAKDGSDKNKDSVDFTKDDSTNKITKEERTVKEIDKKENNNSSSSKEAKDLKDLYKEKIRELREKKELTEKEKLNKDNIKASKESKDKKDAGKDKKIKDKRDKEKDHRSSSSSDHHENKGKVTSIDKSVEFKDKKSESKDKTKKDDKHLSKDKEKSSASSSSSSKFEKGDSKKVSKNGKDGKLEKFEKSEKKDSKSSGEKNSVLKKDKLDVKDAKKDSKGDAQMKDKKRKEEKKSKSKDDHSSLRKNSNDRRSTDRDGSNGSNGSKSSQSSSLSSSSASSKSASSNLPKENNHMSNSSSGDTSDSVEEKTMQLNRSKLMSTEVENAEKIEIESVKGFSPEDNSSNISQESSSSDSSSSSRKRPLKTEDETISNEIKIKKPKFAKNFQEAKKLMKIRKQMEKQKQKRHEDKKLPDTKKNEYKNATLTRSNDLNDLDTVPDEERVQIIEIPDEEYEEPYPDRQTNLTLEERSMILLEGELGTSDLLQKQSRVTATLSDMELCIKQSLDETICCKKPIEFQDLKINRENDTSLCSAKKDSKEFERKASQITNNIENQNVESSGLEVKSTDIRNDIEIVESNDDTAKCCSNDSDIKEDSTITNTRESTKLSRSENSIKENESRLRKFEHVKTQLSKGDSSENSDYEDCRYFNLDNEKSDKFTTFLNSLEEGEGNSLEDIIKSLGGQVVSSVPKNMAPPMTKRKNSTSPLTDILFNNSNNNNDKATAAGAANNDTSVSNVKKRKLIATKSQRYPMNACVSQNILNGENFVMPLSPESDVSATSEKIPPSSVAKEDKSRHRSSQQRYSSDDLYKPRPLFSSSSRRSRRSNQA